MPVIERQEAALTQALSQSWRHGFVTDVEVNALSAGLDKNFVRTISAGKREPGFLLGWRLKSSGTGPVTRQRKSHSSRIDRMSTVTPGSEAGSRRNAVTQPPQLGFAARSNV